MAEVLGAVASGLTLAALFKTCIEAFDLIQTSRHQEGDFKKLKLRLNIEKCRLYIWGEMMGLADTSDPDHERPIDKIRFPDVVRDILRAVFDLFHDSQKIKERYGCRQATSADLVDADQDSSNRSLAASFSNFSIRPSHNSRTSKIVQNLIWVVHDRKKFGALVAEIKDLIDSLQGITRPSVPVARQEGRMRRKIAEIRDSETLSLIAEVCSDDHPDVAEIASTKADTISSATTSRHHVVAWIEDVQESQEATGERMSPDLESLTVAELKQKLLEMMQERKERDITSVSAPEPPVVPPPAETLACSPSGPYHPIKVPSYSPASAALSNTGEDSLADIRSGRANGYGGYGYPPQFTNPWRQGTGFSTNKSTPPMVLRLGAAPPQQNITSPSVAPSSSVHSYQQTGPASSSMAQLSQENETPRNIYQMQRQQVPIENSDFRCTSSVSSLSASSNYDYISNDESAVGSVDDPTDSSSVAYLDRYGQPSSQHRMVQFNSKVSSSTVKKHPCKICDKRFTRPSSLQTHMYSHTGEKPYACTEEGCGRHFSAVSNLRRHRKVHKRGDGGSEHSGAWRDENDMDVQGQMKAA